MLIRDWNNITALKISRILLKSKPWCLVLSFPVSQNRGEAMKIERFIKKQKSKAFIQKLINNSNNPEFFLKLINDINSSAG